MPCSLILLGFNLYRCFNVDLSLTCTSLRSEIMSKYISRSAPVVAKKDDSTDGKVSSKTVVFKDITDENFLSIFTKSNVTGPNVNLAKGPKDELLLWVKNFIWSFIEINFYLLPQHWLRYLEWCKPWHPQGSSSKISGSKLFIEDWSQLYSTRTQLWIMQGTHSRSRQRQHVFANDTSECGLQLTYFALFVALNRQLLLVDFNLCSSSFNPL